MSWSQAKRLLYDCLRLLALVLVGTFGFMWVERWKFLDSLFMTVTTLTTVGYGEVHPLSAGGKVYVIVLILLGVGVIAWVLGDIVNIFLEVNFGLTTMRHRIFNMTDHIVVCGYGRSGQEVAAHFLQQKMPFVIIDQDPEKVKKAEEDGHPVLAGDASEDEILLQAQIKRAKGIVCALPDDSTNTFIILSAKGLNEKINIVSRASNPGAEAKLKRAGAHMVISPYKICGRRMATAVSHPLVTEFLDVLMHTPEHDLRLEQLVIGDKSELTGVTLRDANIKQTAGVMILAVNKSGKLISNPSPDLVFSGGDELIALGTDQQLHKLSELSGSPKSA